MITGLNAMIYTTDAEGARAFLRDKLQFPFTDVGNGWLIFDVPAAELGCHPAEKYDGTAVQPGTHELSFYCDDIQSTVAELRGRGVEFTDTVRDVGYGLATHVRFPGGATLQLCQPHYRRHSAED